MQATPVPRDRCGTVKSGWLETAHPSVEDGKVRRNVCFGSLSTDCGDGRSIFVKNWDYIIYTNFWRLKVVQSASAGQTKSEA